MHTNDDILTCGTPTFGRNSADSIEMTGAGAGLREGRRRLPGGDPVFNGPIRTGVKALDDAADQLDAADGRHVRRRPLHRQDDRSASTAAAR